MKKLIFAVFVVFSAAQMSQAQAVDWCKVLMCMSHPETGFYKSSTDCASEVSSAYLYAKAYQKWGTCESSDADTQIKVSDWQINHDKHGNITSVYGTANVYNNGVLEKQYPF